MARRSDNLRMLGKLLVVTLGMFAFGYLLIPAYKAICEATGPRARSCSVTGAPVASVVGWTSVAVAGPSNV